MLGTGLGQRAAVVVAQHALLGTHVGEPVGQAVDLRLQIVEHGRIRVFAVFAVGAAPRQAEERRQQYRPQKPSF